MAGDQMTDLKPCPFCGGAVEIIDLLPGVQASLFHKCQGINVVWLDRREILVARWNHRPGEDAAWNAAIEAAAAQLHTTGSFYSSLSTWGIFERAAEMVLKLQRPT